MSLYFENEYILRTSDFDKNSHIKPSAILELFQDIAGEHTDSLGIGVGEMLSQNMMWVVTKTKFEITKKPAAHERVKLKTIPLSPSRAVFRREYFMENSNGELLVKGTSDWVLVSRTTRSLMSTKNIYPESDDFCDVCAFAEKTKRLTDFNADNDVFSTYPLFTDIDMNGHVNNSKYADFILNAVSLNSNDIIDTMQIDYHHELFQDSEIKLYMLKNNKEILVKGLNEKNDIVFLSKLLLK